MSITSSEFYGRLRAAKKSTMMASRRNARIFILVVICFVAGCAKQTPSLLNGPNPYDAPLPPFSMPVTPEEVRLAFQKYSAKAIVKKLMENDYANWSMILNKIAEGDKNWITYATIYIAPGTDAGASTGLLAAMAYGLSKNPEAVLGQEVIGLGLSMLNVCSVPFIEPTYEFVKSYGEETLAALQRVDKPYLIDSRDTCIRRLQGSLDFVEKAHREGRWEYY